MNEHLVYTKKETKRLCEEKQQAGRRMAEYPDRANRGKKRTQGPYKTPSQCLLNGAPALGFFCPKCLKLLYALSQGLLSFPVIQFFVHSPRQMLISLLQTSYSRHKIQDGKLNLNYIYRWKFSNLKF